MERTLTQFMSTLLVTLFVLTASLVEADEETKPSNTEPPQSNYYIYRASPYNSKGGSQAAISRAQYVVNFGTREGVVPGSTFRVFRGEIYLGMVRVEQTWRDSATVSLVDLEVKIDRQDPLPFARGDRLFPKYVMLETVNFGTGTPLFSKDMHERLRYTARFILSFPDFPVMLAGHTDNSGKKEKNVELGKSRGEEIRKFLNEVHLVPLQQMHSVGYADDQPLANNSTPEGRKRNRRVEIVLVDELPASR